MTPVLGLLSDPSNWTTNAYARNKDNQQVQSTSPEACKWCLLGAIIKCYSIHNLQIVVAKVKQQNINDLSDFNDTCTHEELIDVLKKAQI